MGSREGWVRGGRKDRVPCGKMGWSERRKREIYTCGLETARGFVVEEKRFSVFDGEELHIRLPFVRSFFFLIYSNLINTKHSVCIKTLTTPPNNSVHCKALSLRS